MGYQRQEDWARLRATDVLRYRGKGLLKQCQFQIAPLVREYLNRNTRHWHTRRSVRCAHVSPARRYFRAHGARYCIKAQMHECTNLLWSDLAGNGVPTTDLVFTPEEKPAAP